MWRICFESLTWLPTPPVLSVLQASTFSSTRANIEFSHPAKLLWQMCKGRTWRWQQTSQISTQLFFSYHFSILKHQRILLFGNNLKESVKNCLSWTYFRTEQKVHLEMRWGSLLSMRSKIFQVILCNKGDASKFM